MPSLKKRKNIKNNKKEGIEDGGWDGGSKFEVELIKIQARNQILEDSWRNVLTIISFVIMCFCFYNAWIDQHDNQYLSIFEVTSGLISAYVARFSLGTPKSEQTLTIVGILQLTAWLYLTSNEYIYHIHCLPLGAINAFLGTTSFMFLRSMKTKTLKSIATLRSLKEKSY